MKKNKIFTMLFILILVFSVTVPVMADDGDVPETETEEKAEIAGKNVLEFFSFYHNYQNAADCDDPLTLDSVEECEDPAEGLDCDDPLTLDIVEGCESEFTEQVAGYHEYGIGFGVLAKLLMVSLDSQDCEETPEPVESVCNPVTFDELIALYLDGMSIGEVFETYGKPVNPGVGGLKNVEKFEEKCPEDGSGPPGFCGDKENGKPDNSDKGKKKP
ncbi:MAG: hypothetical protein HON98_04475 [Chloroflexi bacterium]|nr:hypothetical protein [Chloroflexota bacterium]MBT3671207.1 hypothetical protein [Chloroflexota bacterium]MBT4004377.1 hypothetical protein [Chloroflexota bacterium]MBT4304334.1 hypothetical protein [Chloroflexota bacterium]MBT4534353.1 hypothetical protein [Chloroflexota bacterium]